MLHHIFTLQNSFFFFKLFIYLFILWPRREACEILVPQPGIEPGPPALGAWSLNHWSAREVPAEFLVIHCVTGRKISSIVNLMPVNHK